MKSISDSNLVSIITPAYKAEYFIGETINSVLSQTYPNWELLVADDCSPDGTSVVVSAAKNIDKRIQLVKCERNGGPAAARNRALAHARGRWIAFLDSDDLWLPTKLEESISFAKKHNLPFVFTGYRRVSFDCSVVGRYVSVPEKLTYNDLLSNTAIATSSVLIDRAQIQKIVMEDVYYDDFVCWLHILKRGFTAHGLNKDLLRYRIVPNSFSRCKVKSAIEVWKIYRSVECLGRAHSFIVFCGYMFNAFRKYVRF